MDTPRSSSLSTGRSRTVKALLHTLADFPGTVLAGNPALAEQANEGLRAWASEVLPHLETVRHPRVYHATGHRRVPWTRT